VSAEFEEFLLAGMKAISRYADEEFDRLARGVEYRLRRMPGGEHRNFWIAYCEEMQRGPSPMRSAFEYDVEKLIDFEVAKIPHRQAVLLTVAVMWETEEFEHQDGELVSTDLIKGRIFSALRQLALDDEHEQFWH
jgi:hypothetical protein